MAENEERKAAIALLEEGERETHKAAIAQLKEMALESVDMEQYWRRERDCDYFQILERKHPYLMRRVNTFVRAFDCDNIDKVRRALAMPGDACWATSSGRGWRSSCASQPICGCSFRPCR